MKTINDKSAVRNNLWLVFIVVLLMVYVFFNKPLYFVARNMQPVIMALVFLASFFGIGAALTAPFKLTDKSDSVLHSIALGIGATGVFVFLLGLLGNTSPLPHAIWVLLGLALCAVFMWKQRMPWPYPRDTQSPMTLLGITLFIPFILQALPPLLAPVVSTDALQYQLLIPKIYQLSGKIKPIPFLVESNYPCLAQYIYLLVMNISTDIACQVLHFGVGLLSLFSMGRLVALVNPDSNRWLGPVLFFSMPACLLTASWAWNDMFFVFFMLLCLINLLVYHLAEDKRNALSNIILAGLMAGLASWVKYTFFMAFLCLLLLVILGLNKWKWRWRHLAWFFVSMAPLSMLTFLKNWLFTGNPVFPFFHRIFPSPYWNDAAASYFVHTLRRLDTPHWDWATYFLFPFQFTLKPFFIDSHIGILPLALLPFLFLRSQNRGVSFLKVFCFFYLVSWFLFQTGTRSILTLLAVVLCLGVVEFEQTIWKNQALRRPVVLFLCLASLANLVIIFVTNYHLTRPVSHFLGIESKERFILREARSQYSYAWLNRNPLVKNVLLVGLYAPYYLRRNVLFSSIADPPVAQHLSSGVADPKQLARRLSGLGISHIVIDRKRYNSENKNGLYSWEPMQKKIFEDFIAMLCQKKIQFDQETIYAINPLNP